MIIRINITIFYYKNRKVLKYYRVCLKEMLCFNSFCDVRTKKMLCQDHFIFFSDQISFLCLTQLS